MGRLEDGRTIDLENLPVFESNRFFIVESDRGLLLHFFQDDGTKLVHGASVGIPHDRVEQFAVGVKEVGTFLGVDWDSVQIKHLPKPPSGLSGH